MLPVGLRRRLRARDVQIDDDRFLPAAHHHALYWTRRVGIDFLMRDVRRNVYEITGSGLFHEFQMFAPAESCTAFHYIEDRFEIAVMRSEEHTSELQSPC